MRKTGISIATYNRTENKVEERILKEDSFWSSEMEQFFYENTKLPIYAWYYDDYQTRIIHESQNHEKEWAKIKD